jgi:hypothetical protein
VSSLFRQLELLEEDQQRFESILDRIYRINDVSLEDRRKSWEVISGNGWYENIVSNNKFRSGDLATIFSIVVIASLAEQPPAEVMARWALYAPAPMVQGLLAAAKTADAEMWNYVMEILEPTLAYRWTQEKFMLDFWDDHRVLRSYAGFGRDEGNRGFLGLRRRSGRRS